MSNTYVDQHLTKIVSINTKIEELNKELAELSQSLPKFVIENKFSAEITAQGGLYIENLNDQALSNSEVKKFTNFLKKHFIDTRTVK